MPASLSSARRSELRAQAHKLKPTVLIGDKGLTDEVVTEIDRALRAHELIKVRASSGDRDARDVWMESICEKLGAQPVQQIGKIFVLYREEPREETRPSPRPSPKGEGASRRPPPKGVGANRRAPEAEAEGHRKESAATSKQRARASAPPAEREEGGRSTRSGRPRSRTPSPLPASGSRRRRPRTSR